MLRQKRFLFIYHVSTYLLYSTGMKHLFGCLLQKKQHVMGTTQSCHMLFLVSVWSIYHWDSFAGIWWEYDGICFCWLKHYPGVNQQRCGKRTICRSCLSSSSCRPLDGRRWCSAASGLAAIQGAFGRNRSDLYVPMAKYLLRKYVDCDLGVSVPQVACGSIGCSVVSGLKRKMKSKPKKIEISGCGFDHPIPISGNLSLRKDNCRFAGNVWLIMARRGSTIKQILVGLQVAPACWPWEH